MDRETAEAMALACGTSIARLGLRFDRVVLRVLRDLTQHCDQRVPEGLAVVVTISAPIRRPAAAVAALIQSIDSLVEGQQPAPPGPDAFGNRVGLRLLRVPSTTRGKLVGLVHNPETSPDLLLEMVEAFMRRPLP